MKTFLAAALITILFGCAANGPAIEAAQLNELRRGQTTATELYKQFGRPNFLSKNMDGTQTAIYVRNDEKAGIGTASTPGTEMLTFSFDAKGILTDFKSARTNAAKSATQAVSTAAEKTEHTVSNNAPQTAGANAKSAAKSEPGKSIILNLPGFLPSATKDPRNP